MLKDFSEEQEVYYEALYLDGYVVGLNPIRELLLNGQSILRREGRRLIFSHFVHLHPGKNTIVVRAEDTIGNVTTKTIHIEYLVPIVHQIQCRLKVLLLPFDIKGEHETLGDYIYDALLGAFVDQGRFRLVERSHLDKILFELELGQRDLADRKTAARVGRLAAADTVIAGSAYEREHSVELFAQIIDTESSEIMFSKDVYREDKDLGSIRLISERLALKFKQAMPVIEGDVGEVKGPDVNTDLGSRSRIRRGMRLVIFREGEQKLHPGTGRSLGCETLELAEAVVKGVYEKMSVEELITERQKAEVKPLDRVITK